LTQLVTPPFRVQISETIPAPMAKPQGLVIPKWFWPLVAVLLGVVLAVLVRRRIKSQDQWAKVMEPFKSDELDIRPPLDVSTEVPPLPVVLADGPRRTQVGGYYFPVPKPGQPAVILLGVSGPVEGQRFPIEKEIFHIGASPENDLLIANDEYVSGDHAYLRYEKGNCFIFDNSSRNGTFVNQHAVTNTGVALGLGDYIQIGISTFEVVIAPS